jgi:hypothetical protein
LESADLPLQFIGRLFHVHGGHRVMILPRQITVPEKFGFQFWLGWWHPYPYRQ